MVGLIIAFMLAFYFYILFKNGIEPNEIVIEFSFLYILSCALILILIWILRKGSPKAPTISAIVLVVIMIGVKSYIAIEEIPDHKINLQMELATILGKSPQFQELGIHDIYDIDSVLFHGAPKKGDFEQLTGYVIEVRVKNHDQPYYFMCAGTGDGCSQFEQVEESLALRLIDEYQ